ETLQYGEHGELVRFLQQKLSKIAYYEDHIDGEYGDFTEYALKKFQKDYDITITGEADPQTVYALVQAEKEKIMEKIKNLSGTISIDMKSDDVQIIQESLQYLGYYQGEVDGIFGPLTEQAVRTVEERHNIDLIDESALATVYENEQEEALVDTNEATQEQEVEEVVSDLPQDEDEMVEHETDEGETSSDPESDSELEENAEQHSSEESQIASEKEENEEQSVPSEGFDQNDLIGEARAHIGTPYVWGGENPGGFDCSGFIQYVFQTQNISIQRTVREIWNFSQPVSAPSVGDLVFFETYQPGPSHMGIYLGNHQFIHAGSSNGVQISDLNESYWSDRYLGAKQVQ